MCLEQLCRFLIFLKRLHLLRPILPNFLSDLRIWRLIADFPMTVRYSAYKNYYEFDIAQRIQDLDSYEKKDWKGLIKKMKAIYKDGDIDQQRYTRVYLTILIYKTRGKKEVDLYSRQFRSI